MRRKSTVTALVGTLLALCALLTCGTVSANEGPTYYLIHDLVQDGQDVELVIKSRIQSRELSLVRVGEDYEKVLFENEPIMEEVDPTPDCWDGSPWCHPSQDDCHDCDDDGFDECPVNVECIDAFFFYYHDECVYPGKTEYRLYSGNITGDEEGDYAHNRYLDVEDTGIECDYDITFYDDDSGCSVSRLGSRDTAALGLTLLLLVIGITAFRTRQ